MSSINQITAVVVESLLNSPYKGYYKKDYLSVLKTLNSIYQEKQKFEDWMVDDFVNQIVGGTKDLLKRYPKLGKSKECARNMLEHYIYWSYEIGNVEEAENIKKSYEETTGLKYNKNKLQDIIYVNKGVVQSSGLVVQSSGLVVCPTTSKSATFTFTPPKHLDKNKIFRFNIEGSIEHAVEEKEMKTNNIFINMIKIILFFLFLKFTTPSFNAIVENGKSVVSGALGLVSGALGPVGIAHFESLWSGNPVPLVR
jgi:tRNA(His) 5'-end guanylyltransferase